MAYPPEGVLQHPFSNTRALFFALESSPLLSIRRGPKPRIDAKSTMQQDTSQLLVPVGQSIDSIQAEDVVLSTLPEERPREEVIEESHLQTTFTEDQHLAASLIQKTFRRFSCRKSSQPSDPSLDKFYQECLTVSRSLECSPHYKYLVRGPLPHFLVCLAAFKKALEGQKFKQTVLAQKVEHTELEEAWAKLNKIKLVPDTNTSSSLVIFLQIYNENGASCS